MMNNIMEMYQQIRSNPMQLLSRKFNIPPNVNMNDPNAILQHLLNSGQISQQQVNWAMGMRNNPMFNKLLSNGKN